MKPREMDLSLFEQGYDEQTHVLTTRGWQRFDQLQDDDRVFVWRNGVLDLEKMPEVYIARYTGRMHNFVNRHVDIMCMPGTKVLAVVKAHTHQKMPDGWNKHPSDWAVFRAEYIKNSWQLAIPTCGRFEGTKMISPKTAYDIGLWCSGVMREDIDIRLDREAMQMLHQIVENRAFEPKSPEEYQRIMRHLARTHEDRELYWDMLLWKIAAREQLILGLMDGKGRRYPPALVWLFLSTKEGRTDIFQALTMSMGWRAQISAGNGVFFSTVKTTSSVFYKHRRSPEDPWTGVVWNIKTDAGAMVTRRNFKIAVVSTL